MKTLCLSNFFTKRVAVRAALFNSLWLLLDKGLRLVGGLFIGVWVARYLAPEAFGFFNTWTAVYGLALTLIGFGFDQVLVRYLAKYPSREHVLIGTVVGVRFLISFLTASVLISSAFFTSVNLDIWIFIGFCSGFLASPFLTLRQWFEARVMSKYVVITELAAFVVASVLKIVGVLYAFPVSWFVFVVIFEGVLGVFGYGLIYRKQRKSRHWKFNWKVARLLFSQSWPLLMSCFAIFVYTKIDQIMLLSLAGPEAAGIYAAAARISEILYFLPAIIVSSVLPGLTILPKTDLAKYTRQLGFLFSGVALMSYLISVIVVVLAPIIVSLLYGEPYMLSVPVLIIHVLSFVWISMGIMSSVFILNEKIMRYVLVRDYTAVVLNVGLNFWLIPYYGAVGAAISTLIAYSFVSVWGNAFFPKLRPLFKLQLQGLMLAGLYEKWRSLRSG